MNPKVFVILAFAVAYLEGKTVIGIGGDWTFSLGKGREKTFYINRIERSWDDAMELCKSHNMKLATVTTLAEVDRLDKHLTKANINSHYWTAGRREAVWTIFEEAFNSELLGQIDYFAEDECMAFRVPRAEYSTQWSTLPCTDVWPVICENVYLTN